MGIEFSNINRVEKLKNASQNKYDLIIIGGGITGAGIALDASLRGMKVLLLEKKDFASGTSSKSTKLIHGGLRYLKQLEFGLVAETGRERAVAHNNICHLVHPENMLLPIVKNGSFSQFSASIAISVYDRLANVEADQRRKKLSRKDIIETEPLLRKDILKSGILYFEYRTDDARLTIELIKAAKRNGADAFNYAEISGFKYTDDQISGVICHDLIHDMEFEISATHVVSSAGPWVDILRTKDDPQTETNLHLSKGVHLVLKKEDFNIQNSIYFDAFDGRMIFAIPRGESVYIGTTDTTFKGDKDDIRCTIEDANYLLKALNNMFDMPSITLDHIQSTWAGLRPLIQQKGKGTSELSRKDEIFISDSGLISIAGGKLTGFRKMAKRIVDLLEEKTSTKYGECKTKDYQIHKNPFKNYKEYLDWIDKVDSENNDLSRPEVEFLLSTYGKDALKIIDDAQSSDLVESQLMYCINNENVFHPLDFLDRRTGWLFFDIEKVKNHLEKVTKIIAREFSKDETWITSMIKECKNKVDINSLKELKHSN